MNTIKITTTQNIELEYDLASLGERIVGFLIDLLILFAYFVILSFFIYNTHSIGQKQWVAYILYYIPFCLYDITSEVFMNGQSVGKKAMNIKVISLDGGQPTVGQYLIRWVFRLIDFTLSFYLGGLICIAVTPRKQRLGDLVAGTTLIKTIPRTTFQQTMYAPVQHEDYRVSFPEVVNLSDNDMQLIQEVILNVRTSGNYRLASQAADKIMETLHIQNNMEPVTFLKILLSDYNYLTSRNEA